MSFNKWIGIGRTTKEIELQITQSGKQYIQFNLAVDNGKGQNGDSRQADFIPCVAWDKKAENLSVYVHKGNRIAIEGRLKVEQYQDLQGQNKYKTYILVQNFTFLESKPKDNFVPSEPDYIANKQEEKDPFEAMAESIEISESDLPF